MTINCPPIFWSAAFQQSACVVFGERIHLYLLKKQHVFPFSKFIALIGKCLKALFLKMSLGGHAVWSLTVLKIKKSYWKWQNLCWSKSSDNVLELAALRKLDSIDNQCCIFLITCINRLTHRDNIITHLFVHLSIYPSGCVSHFLCQPAYGRFLKNQILFMFLNF